MSLFQGNWYAGSCEVAKQEEVVFVKVVQSLHFSNSQLKTSQECKTDMLLNSLCGQGVDCWGFLCLCLCKDLLEIVESPLWGVFLPFFLHFGHILPQILPESCIWQVTNVPGGQIGRLVFFLATWDLAGRFHTWQPPCKAVHSRSTCIVLSVRPSLKLILLIPPL